MTYLSIRTGVKNKENIIPRLLLKVDIAPAFTIRITTLHFNKAVHRFALSRLIESISRSSITECLEAPQPDLQAFQFVPRESFRLLRRCEPLSHLFCRVSPQRPPRNGCRWRLEVRHSGWCPLVSCLERFVLPASF